MRAADRRDPDELFGYKYTDYASRRCLPAGRARSASGSCTCTMSSGLTAASPPTASRPARASGDLDFVCATSWAIDPEKEAEQLRRAKYSAAKAFEGDWRSRRISGAKKLPSPMPWATAWWTTSRSTPRACTPMRSSSSAGQTTRPTVCPLQGGLFYHEIFGEILPRPEPHHRGLLDAEQGMARLQRQRPFCPCAGKLRRFRRVILFQRRCVRSGHTAFLFTPDSA